MATKKSVTKPNTGVILTAAIIVAMAGAYVFGRIALYAYNGGLSCGTMGEVSGCNSILVYLIGFYLGLLLCISFAQAAYIRNQIAYFGILALALATVLLASTEMTVLVFGYSIAGMFAGFAYRRFLEKRR